MRGSGKKQAAMRRGAQPVADFVSELVDPIVRRRAGMTLDLISSWSEIAGTDHAEGSRPEKLEWPRSADEGEPFQPATLVVACEGARAVYLQHETAMLLGRINTYFGFTAVSRVRFVQRSFEKPQPQRRVSKGVVEPAAAHRLQDMLRNVDDPVLRQALEKMGRGVFSERSERDR